jgi:hypothetical protein
LQEPKFCVDTFPGAAVNLLKLLHGCSAKYRQINAVGCKLWAKEVSMKPIRVPDLSPEQLTELEEL